MDLSEGLEMGPALSLPSSDRSRAFSQCTLCGSFCSEAPVLHISSSEELDVESIEAGDVEDSPPHSSLYEKLVEIVTCAVARLNIDWPAERQDVRPKSKLDECFLPSEGGIGGIALNDTQQKRSLACALSVGYGLSGRKQPDLYSTLPQVRLGARDKSDVITALAEVHVNLNLAEYVRLITPAPMILHCNNKVCQSSSFRHKISLMFPLNGNSHSSRRHFGESLQRDHCLKHMLKPSNVIGQRQSVTSLLVRPSHGHHCSVAGSRLEVERGRSQTMISKCELQLASAYCYEDLEEYIFLNPPSPLVLPRSKSPVSPKILPSLPLPHPMPITPCSLASPPLFPFSPSAPPLLTLLCCVDLPRIFWSPAPLPATQPVTLAYRPVGSTWDHHPYGSTMLPQAPSSLQLCLGQTLHCLRHRRRPSAALHLSTPSALLGSTFPLAPPWSSVPLAQPQMLVSRSIGVAWAHQIFGSTWSSPPSAPSQSVAPLGQPAKSQPWLLPPSTLLWASVLAGFWVPTWLLLLSSPP
ncbi:hypothetical protein DPX16_18785 [Anabarilius grahami]|uniref:Uncharacterized protein n=1 Tax=Anabarilius grahami TaxID=495550 RepID=A0A3N0Y1U3_ANAGA|nr:hypothetical protein DPX16_18785 [Anabarilius grahami]